MIEQFSSLSSKKVKSKDRQEYIRSFEIDSNVYLDNKNQLSQALLFFKLKNNYFEPI